MFGLKLPEEYYRRLDDLESSAYTDRVFMVYSDDRYVELTTSTPNPDLYRGVVAIYEVNKSEQTSHRVY